MSHPLPFGRTEEQSTGADSFQSTAAQLAALVDSTQDLVWSVDLNHRILTCNAAFRAHIAQAYGLQLALGMRQEDVLPADRAALWPPLYDRALAGGPFRVEYPLHDGRIVELAFNPIVEDGQTTGIAVFGKDISRQVAAEQALRESEEKFSRLFQCSPDAIVIADPDDDRIVMVNDAFERLTGYPREALIGRRSVEMDLWAEPQAHAEVIRRWRAAGAIHNFECRLRRKNGEIRTLLLSGSLITLHGRTFALSTSTDLTDRRMAENRYQRLYEGMRDGFVAVDMSGRIVESNEAFRGMVGYKADELLTMSYRDLTPDQWWGFEEGIVANQVLPRGYSSLYEKEYRRRDGTVFPIELRTELIRDAAGEPVAMWAIVRDISSRKQMERTMQQSEQKFEMLFRSNPAAIGISDVSDNLRIVDVNDAWVRATGYERDEAIGHSAVELGLWADPLEFESVVRRLQQHRSLRGFEFVFRRKNGELGHGVAASEVVDLDGRPLALSAILDVTEQRRLEKELRGSKERLSMVLEANSEGVWDWNIPSKNAVFSPGYCRMLGYEPEEFAKDYDAWRALVHPDDIARVDLAHAEHINNRKEFCVELRMRHKSGEWRWILSRGMVVERDAADRAIRMVGTHIEITGRKRIEEALREANQFSEQVINSAREGVVVYGPDLRYQVWNPFMVELSGMTAEQVIGRHPLEVFPFLREVGLYERLEKSLAGETGEPFDLPMGLPGSARSAWVSNLSGPLRNTKGEIVGVIATVRDVTDRKLAEARNAKLEAEFRQAQKLESIGRLAGGVAHDFNNLLTVINGYSAELVERLSPLDPLHAKAREINSAGEHAAGLTRQLLAFSRKQAFQPRVMDLNGTVRDVERVLVRLIGEDIAVVTSLDPSLGQLMADPDQIHQVLMNLVVNARDAMPEGGTLRIETRNVDLDERAAAGLLDAVPGQYVLLQLSDTGIGMDEHTVQHAFEPFFTTKEQGKGTGLGLSTVYGIVRQSGGYIDVRSKVGGGTTFSVYLPRTNVPPLREGAIEHPPLQPGGETILVVEDQDLVSRFVKAILVSYGYHVLQAGNWDQARAVAAAHPGRIHLLLTDVVLPGLNGREVAARLRQGNPSLKVLFMSGYAAEVTARRGVLDPGVPFLQKPFSPSQLAAKVASLLSAP